MVAEMGAAAEGTAAVAAEAVAAEVEEVEEVEEAEAVEAVEEVEAVEAVEEVEVANNLLQRPQLMRAPGGLFDRNYSDRGFAVSGWPRLS
jgi:hypothetical protein